MRYTRHLTVIATILSIVTLVQAQPEPPRREGGPRHGRMMEMIDQVLADLNLSAEQKEKIDPILADAREEGHALREDLKDADPQERRETMRQFMQAIRKKIEAELTEEQRAALESKIQEMRQRGPGGEGATTRPAPGGAAGIDRLERLADALEKLELTDEQRVAVTGAFANGTGGPMVAGMAACSVIALIFAFVTLG